MTFRAWLPVVIGVPCALFSSPRPHAEPRTPASADASCIGCHADVAKEWSGSLHRAAFTDSAFQKGFAIEPEAFCRNCHEPTSQGVACTSCHGLPEGDTHPTSNARASCAPCHEFAFENAPSPPERASMMQLTMTEHGSDARDCTSCHMKHGSHAFAVSRNASFLQSALATDVSRTRDGSIEVTLTPREVGHAFPTGDMFRRVLLRLEVLASDGHAIYTRERAFERTFTIANGSKRTVTDTRLTGATKTSFAVGALTKTHPSRVRVIYQRRTTAVVVEDEITLADVSVPPMTML